MACQAQRGDGAGPRPDARRARYAAWLFLITQWGKLGSAAAAALPAIPTTATVLGQCNCYGGAGNARCDGADEVEKGGWSCESITYCERQSTSSAINCGDSTCSNDDVAFIKVQIMTRQFRQVLAWPRSWVGLFVFEPECQCRPLLYKVINVPH